MKQNILFRLEPTVHTSLIVLYSLVIIFGVIGNFAIVLAFLTNKVMLTTRNIFIANLAISDILLCSFTMPLTLVDLLTKVGEFIMAKSQLDMNLYERKINNFKVKKISFVMGIISIVLGSWTEHGVLVQADRHHPGQLRVLLRLLYRVDRRG